MFIILLKLFFCNILFNEILVIYKEVCYTIRDEEVVMLKKGFLIFLVLMIVGCSLTRKKIYPDFTVKFFYKDGCGYCEAFKEYALPTLEKEFKDAMKIEYYNLDEEESLVIYNNICDQLYFFYEEYRGDTPLFVMDNKFALLGYSAGEEKELIRDIQRALNNEELGNELSLYRWEFTL